MTGALTADDAYEGGWYEKQLVRGLRAMARVYAGWGFSQAFYWHEAYRRMGYSSLEDFLVGFWEGFFLDGRDANNLLTMLWTWQNGDIGQTPGMGGDHEKALASIRARALVMPDFPTAPNPDVMCTADEMLDSLGKPEVVKLDVRDEEEWRAESSSPYGVDFVERKGRIPGSTWIDWNLLLTLGEETKGCFNVVADKGEYKDLTEVEKMLEEKGVTKDKPVTLYCFKGARTSNTYLVMKMLGYDNVKTYFGSWNEWSKDPSLPIEKGAPQEVK